MLNQVEPASNMLLSREVRRRSAYETFVVDTSGENWMAPFSEHLGLPPQEFTTLKPIFSSYKSKVLLVEGTTDQEYFCFLQKDQHCCETLAKDIEVVPYGGTGTLKNTLLMQFVFRKFDKVFVTYDLDADGEIRGSLLRLGLKEHLHFMAMGVHQAGKDCIEGLLPQRVLSAVTGKETDLVMKLGSKENTERRKAKEALKRKYLEEFTQRAPYEKDEIREMAKIIKAINARFQMDEKTTAPKGQI
jgi:hypothetical protein